MEKISKWLFGTREYRVLLLGDDFSGKTTFLHRLAFDSVPANPLPTEAFNVETVIYPAHTSWVLWEFRASRRNFPLIYRELTPWNLVLWLHDCTENGEGILDSLRQVADEMVRRGCRFLWVGLNKQDDASVDAKTVTDARELYQQALEKYKGSITWMIFTHKLSGKTGEGVVEVLDELHSTVRRVKLEEAPKHTRETSPGPSQEAPVEELSLEQLQRRLEQHIRNDTLDPDAFWKAFTAGNLQEWNHYTHLRAAYFLILASQRKSDIYALGEEIACALNSLREQSSPKLAASMPALFSVTLSTFWTVKLQRAITLHRNHSMSIDLPSRNDFAQVLRRCPSLINPQLWNAHWSHDPTPSGVGRRYKDTFRDPNRIPLDIHTEYLVDPALIAIPTSDGSTRPLRYAFNIMQHLRRTHTAPGRIIPEALSALQHALIRSRLHDSSPSPQTPPCSRSASQSTAAARVPSYSETQAYFWMQIVDAALQSLRGPTSPVRPEDISFADFQAIFGIDAGYWREFYSEKLWEGVLSRARYVMPDRRPVPVLIMFDEGKARGVLKGVGGIRSEQQKEERDEAWVVLPASMEERVFHVRMLQQQLGEEGEREMQSSAMTSHGHLLFHLYTAFTKNDEAEEGESLSGSRSRLHERARKLFSELTSPTVAGATQRDFWIQQVGVAVSHSLGFSAITTSSSAGSGYSGRGGLVSTFSEFITRNAYLVFENLWAVYYSRQVWDGAEAREGIVAPDRRRMARIVQETGEEGEEQRKGQGQGYGHGHGQGEGDSEEWVQVKTELHSE
ncbi:hypothetical protein BJX64DRAFT_294895 [Aspergillus heterothallicus]